MNSYLKLDIISYLRIVIKIQFGYFKIELNEYLNFKKWFEENVSNDYKKSGCLYFHEYESLMQFGGWESALNRDMKLRGA